MRKYRGGVAAIRKRQLIGNGGAYLQASWQTRSARMSASASGESCSFENSAQLWRNTGGMATGNVARGAAISR
jgi:hypothetical protein